MTVRFVTDEHIGRFLIAGLQRQAESIDIVRVQDVGLRTMDDPTLLQWAADEGPALVTHDIRTMPDFAHERVAAGLPMPGVFVVPADLPIGVAIEELATIAGASWRPSWWPSSQRARDVHRFLRLRRDRNDVPRAQSGAGNRGTRSSTGHRHRRPDDCRERRHIMPSKQVP